MTLASGVVAELHRWPVKSFGGEPVEQLRIAHRGVGGDRTHTVWDSFKGEPRQLTAGLAPRLLAWRASYGGADFSPADPPRPMITAPTGDRYEWDDPKLIEALGADLGRPITLRSDASGLSLDLPGSVHVTVRATLEAVTAELGFDRLDLRRMRTNVHLVLDVPAFAEHEWVGRQLNLGGATLAIVETTSRCVIPTRDPDTGEKEPRILRHLVKEHGGLFGCYARYLGVLDEVPVAVGDAVTVE